MKLKTYFLTCLCGIIIILLSVSSIIYYIDPYFQYHAPQENLSYDMEMNSFSYYNPGIAKNFSYDTIITGSSMSRSFLPSYINKKFNCKTVKLSMAEARGKDFSILLPVVLKNRNVSRIIIGLDTFAYTVDKDYSAYEKPMHLYDYNLLNDVLYLTNMDGLIESATVINDTLKNRTSTTMDSYQNYVSENTFSAEKVINIFKENYPSSQSNSTDLLAQERTILDNLNQNLIPFIVKHPDVEFLFYFPPYSIARWGLTADVNAEIEAMKVIIEELINYSNVSLFFYQGETSCITDLSHYMDTIHYDSIVANNIVDYMSETDNKLTPENYQMVLSEFENFIINYDFAALAK